MTLFVIPPLGPRRPYPSLTATAPRCVGQTRFGAEDKPPKNLYLDISQLGISQQLKKPGWGERLKNSWTFLKQEFTRMSWQNEVKNVCLSLGASTALTAFMGPLHLIFIPTFLMGYVGIRIAFPMLESLWHGLKGDRPPVEATPPLSPQGEPPKG